MARSRIKISFPMQHGVVCLNGFPPLERWNGFCHQLPRLIFRHNVSLLHDRHTLVDHLLHGDIRSCETTVLETIRTVCFGLRPVRLGPEDFRFRHRHGAALTKWPLRSVHHASSCPFLILIFITNSLSGGLAINPEATDCLWHLAYYRIVKIISPSSRYHLIGFMRSCRKSQLPP